MRRQLPVGKPQAGTCLWFKGSDFSFEGHQPASARFENSEDWVSESRFDLLHLNATHRFVRFSFFCTNLGHGSFGILLKLNSFVFFFPCRETRKRIRAARAALYAWTPREETCMRSLPAASWYNTVTKTTGWPHKPSDSSTVAQSQCKQTVGRWNFIIIIIFFFYVKEWFLKNKCLPDLWVKA